MMVNLDWETIKEFYKEHFGIDGWVVEMYANLDILSLCASGASNRAISRFLELPTEEIARVLNETFQFDGWGSDLPLNPYKMYCSLAQDSAIEPELLILQFVEDVSLEMKKFPTMDSTDPTVLFKMCRTMYDIERKILDEWI